MIQVHRLLLGIAWEYDRHGVELGEEFEEIRQNEIGTNSITGSKSELKSTLLQAGEALKNSDLSEGPGPELFDSQSGTEDPEDRTEHATEEVPGDPRATAELLRASRQAKHTSRVRLDPDIFSKYEDVLMRYERGFQMSEPFLGLVRDETEIFEDEYIFTQYRGEIGVHFGENLNIVAEGERISLNPSEDEKHEVVYRMLDEDSTLNETVEDVMDRSDILEVGYEIKPILNNNGKIKEKYREPLKQSMVKIDDKASSIGLEYAVDALG